MKILINILSISFLFVSCQQKTFDSKEEMLVYLKNPDNGYFQEKTVNEIDFSLLYKPTDLLVSQSLVGNSGRQQIDSLRSHYNKYLYFKLTISNKGEELLSVIPNSKSEFGELVNTLTFGMNEHIGLYTNKKENIVMLDYAAPRTYGAGKDTSILFVYPKNEKVINSDYLYFQIDDFGFGHGEVKFKLSTKIIQDRKLQFL